VIPRKPEEITEADIISPTRGARNRMPPGKSRTKNAVLDAAWNARNRSRHLVRFEVDGLVEHPQKWIARMNSCQLPRSASMLTFIVSRAGLVSTNLLGRRADPRAGKDRGIKPEAKLCRRICLRLYAGAQTFPSNIS